MAPFLSRRRRGGCFKPPIKRRLKQPPRPLLKGCFAAFSLGRVHPSFAKEGYPGNPQSSCYDTNMGWIERIAEERIRAAQDEGLFDNLPGKGQPLQLDDDSAVPEELRLTFKILRNAGYLPIEMEIRKEIYSLQRLLNATIDEETRRELRLELSFLLLKENLSSLKKPRRRTG